MTEIKQPVLPYVSISATDDGKVYYTNWIGVEYGETAVMQDGEIVRNDKVGRAHKHAVTHGYDNLLDALRKAREWLMSEGVGMEEANAAANQMSEEVVEKGWSIMYVETIRVVVRQQNDVRTVRMPEGVEREYRMDGHNLKKQENILL